MECPLSDISLYSLIASQHHIAIMFRRHNALIRTIAKHYEAFYELSRHEMLKEYFQCKSDEVELKGTQPDWYPAGISSMEYSQCVVGDGGGEEPGTGTNEELQVCEMEWMDTHTVSTKDLHDAAALIKRCTNKLFNS